MVRVNGRYLSQGRSLSGQTGEVKSYQNTGQFYVTRTQQNIADRQHDQQATRIEAKATKPQSEHPEEQLEKDITKSNHD